MMGKRVMAEPVFSTVWIDDHLPAGHLLRAVDALLDTAFVRRIMAPHYSLIGRPSIDPELMCESAVDFCADQRQRGAGIRDRGALTPTPPGVMRRGRSLGVPGPACG